MKRRFIVVPLISNSEGEYLLRRMAGDRGVYPGQWGLPGGGIEEDETMEGALRREVREELGLEIEAITPRFFKDATHHKQYPDGRREPLYMVFLIFDCRAKGRRVRLNDEFTEYAWVPPHKLAAYDLNDAALDTFRRSGLIGGSRR